MCRSNGRILLFIPPALMVIMGLLFLSPAPLPPSSSSAFGSLDSLLPPEPADLTPAAKETTPKTPAPPASPRASSPSSSSSSSSPSSPWSFSLSRVRPTHPPPTVRPPSTWEFPERYEFGRLVPGFLIAGAAKGGTTSLYYYLSQHPQIAPARMKETHYLKSPDYIRETYLTGFFPSQKNVQNRARPIMTGEATPGYMYYPGVAARIAAEFPEMKVIVMLREPVKRVESHFRFIPTNMSLEEVVDYLIPLARDCLAQSPTLATTDDPQVHLEFMSCASASVAALRARDPKFSDWFLTEILFRSLYLPQVAILLSAIPREQVLFLKSEDFFRDPQASMREVGEFLKLKRLNWNIQTKYNYQKGKIVMESPETAAASNMTSEVRRALTNFYRPFAGKLKELTGISWD